MRQVEEIVAELTASDAFIREIAVDASYGGSSSKETGSAVLMSCRFLVDHVEMHNWIIN